MLHEREQPVTMATSEIKYEFLKKGLSYVDERIIISSALKLTTDLFEADLVIPSHVQVADDVCGCHTHLTEHVVWMISKAGEAGLTHGEFQMMLGDMLMSAAKYIIRYERHGDTDKPGGLADSHKIPDHH